MLKSLMFLAKKRHNLKCECENLKTDIWTKFLLIECEQNWI